MKEGVIVLVFTYFKVLLLNLSSKMRSEWKFSFKNKNKCICNTNVKIILHLSNTHIYSMHSVMLCFLLYDKIKFGSYRIIIITVSVLATILQLKKSISAFIICTIHSYRSEKDVTSISILQMWQHYSVRWSDFCIAGIQFSEFPSGWFNQ